MSEAEKSIDANRVYVRSLFCKYDEDNSGQIDRKELKNLCYDLGFYFTDEEVDQTLRIIDTDNSGEISFDEFFKFWSKNSHKFLGMGGNNVKNLRFAIGLFRKYDKNCTGQITREHYPDLCRDMGHVWQSDAELDQSMAHLDKNGDGSISFNEFIAWLRWDVWKEPKQ